MTFLNLPVSQFVFFLVFFFGIFFFFSNTQQCLKIYRLNIIKKIKKDYKKARQRYQNHCKEEKEKKKQYDCKCYKNVSENEK